ncbi:MAG TPA: hypothetical protein VK110_00080 [Salinisphaeraceae bacterium]|nr:hypothetical protein [Salinisphaeraceae bacterium]
MNQSISNRTAGSGSDRNILWLAYILHGLAFFNGVTAIAGVIINHIKYAEGGDAIIASHHRWLLRTFWYSLLWAVICIPLAFVFIGFIGFGIVAIWFIYRLVRGVLALVDNKAMPMPAGANHHGSSS